MQVSISEEFEQVIKYLRQYPGRLSWRSKKNMPDVVAGKGLENLFDKFKSGRTEIVKLLTPKTVPDPIVHLIMEQHYGYASNSKALNEKIHSESMAAEKIIGDLLEQYLAFKLKPFGWIWCSGSIVKAVDFIKWNDSKWISLQIKNRSNSENSASKSVRENTDIIKWHRKNAMDGTNEWVNFPDKNAASLLSEEEFVDFVSKQMKKLKSQ